MAAATYDVGDEVDLPIPRLGKKFSPSSASPSTNPGTGQALRERSFSTGSCPVTPPSAHPRMPRVAPCTHRNCRVSGKMRTWHQPGLAVVPTLLGERAGTGHSPRTEHRPPTAHPRAPELGSCPGSPAAPSPGLSPSSARLPGQLSPPPPSPPPPSPSRGRSQPSAAGTPPEVAHGHRSRPRTRQPRLRVLTGAGGWTLMAGSGARRVRSCG